MKLGCRWFLHPRRLVSCILRKRWTPRNLWRKGKLVFVFFFRASLLSWECYQICRRVFLLCKWRREEMDHGYRACGVSNALMTIAHTLRSRLVTKKKKRNSRQQRKVITIFPLGGNRRCVDVVVVTVRFPPACSSVIFIVFVFVLSVPFFFRFMGIKWKYGGLFLWHALPRSRQVRVTVFYALTIHIRDLGSGGRISFYYSRFQRFSSPIFWSDLVSG